MNQLQKIAQWCVFFCLVSAATAQGPAVNQVATPPPAAVQQIFDYAGGSNLVYIAYALSDQGKDITVAISAASNANPVSLTATAHGFDYQSLATATPTVCISGGTGNWTGVNGCWAVTPTSANAFTIPVDSGAFGALTGTLVGLTRAPQTTKPCWAVFKNVYDAGNKLIWNGWATLPGGAGATSTVAGSTAMSFIWANRALLSYQ